MSEEEVKMEQQRKPETFSLNKPLINSQKISVDKPPLRPVSHTPPNPPERK